MSSDVMDALTALNPGDDVTFTVVREDGEELELDGYVVDAYREDPEKHGFGYVKGSLTVDIELPNNVVERLQDRDDGWLEPVTHNVDINAKEPRPGKWEGLSVTMWTPEVDGGTVTGDEWTDMGELTDVERSEPED